MVDTISRRVGPEPPAGGVSRRCHPVRLEKLVPPLPLTIPPDCQKAPRSPVSKIRRVKVFSQLLPVVGPGGPQTFTFRDVAPKSGRAAAICKRILLVPPVSERQDACPVFEMASDQIGWFLGVPWSHELVRCYFMYCAAILSRTMARDPPSGSGPNLVWMLPRVVCTKSVAGPIWPHFCYQLFLGGHS